LIRPEAIPDLDRVTTVFAYPRSVQLIEVRFDQHRVFR